MGRPNGRHGATVEKNMDTIARARDRQREYVDAKQDLEVALKDIDSAQDRVNDAERRLCKLHGDDEALCRKMRCENAALSVPETVPA